MGLIQVHSSQHPVWGDDAITPISKTGYCPLIVNNLSDAEVVINRGTYVGSISYLNPAEISEVSLSKHDAIERTPPVKTSIPREQTERIKEYVKQQQIPDAHLDDYVQTLTRNFDIFSTDKHDIGCTKTFEHKIHLKDDTPVYQKQFRIPDTHRSIILEHLQNWLKLGIVKPSKSRYNSPIFCVKKKNTTEMRPVLDYRGLNAHSHIDKHSSLDVQACIDQIGQAKSSVFSSLDLTSGFWQLPLHPNSREYTAFTIPGVGSFEWCRTPMGLLGSPSTFQRLMEYVMRNTINALVYQDDILIHSATHLEHLAHLEDTFARLRAHGLKLNLGKCSFASKKVDYLGFTVSDKGVLPGHDKTKAIKDFPPPNSIRQVREFCGLCNYFRNSVPNFTAISQHLTKLLKKDSQWKGGELPTDSLDAFQNSSSASSMPQLWRFPTHTSRIT